MADFGARPIFFLLCKKKIINWQYELFYETKLNNKLPNGSIEVIDSKEKKKKMIDEFRKIYGEKK